MDEAWRRVRQELSARGKNLTWLAEKLGCDRPRVYSWQARQSLPESAYREVSAALGKTPNWLAGIDESGDMVSPMGREILRLFERIESDTAQMAAFVQIIEICARANDAPSAPLAAQPVQQPKREHARGK